MRQEKAEKVEMVITRRMRGRANPNATIAATAERELLIPHCTATYNFFSFAFLCNVM